MNTTNPTPQATEPSTSNIDMADYRQWQAEKKAAAEKAAADQKAAQIEADRAEQGKRLAEAAWTHDMSRCKRAVSVGMKTATGILGAALAAATLAAITVAFADITQDK
jgi:hypothetical protein